MGGGGGGISEAAFQSEGDQREIQQGVEDFTVGEGADEGREELEDFGAECDGVPGADLEELREVGGEDGGVLHEGLLVVDAELQRVVRHEGVHQARAEVGLEVRPEQRLHVAVQRRSELQEEIQRAEQQGAVRGDRGGGPPALVDQLDEREAQGELRGVCAGEGVQRPDAFRERQVAAAEQRGVGGEQRGELGLVDDALDVAQGGEEELGVGVCADAEPGGELGEGEEAGEVVDGRGGDRGGCE